MYIMLNKQIKGSYFILYYLLSMVGDFEGYLIAAQVFILHVIDSLTL